MNGGTGRVLFSKVSARVPALLLALLLWSGSGSGLTVSATLPEVMDSQASRSLSPEDQVALELGRKVSAVAEALKDPRKPGAMQAVVELGLDQRYYRNVRFSLNYEPDTQGLREALESLVESCVSAVQGGATIIVLSDRDISREKLPIPAPLAVGAVHQGLLRASERPNANIIIAGDLNDNPDDISIAENLGAIEPTQPYLNKRLYNLSIKQYKTGEGTLYYRGWDMFDQIIVSTSILNGQNGMMANSRDQVIVKKDWMLYYPKRAEPRPNRTATSKYFGGYSDHLPVYLKMTIR